MTSEIASRPMSRFSLPLFMTRDLKYPVAVLMFAIAIVVYLCSNHFPIFPPRELPMTWIDSNVPFIPQTVWIYISEYLFFFVVYSLCKDMENANKFIYSFLTLQIVSVVIFWLWPTTYPRHLFPLDPERMDPVTYYVFSGLRQTDAPNNCCPSLHVSSVYLSSFLYLDEQRRKFPWIFLWATAIAISTLTTKQHYLVDIVTGLLLAFLHYFVFHKLISYRSLRQANR